MSRRFHATEREIHQGPSRLRIAPRSLHDTGRTASIRRPPWIRSIQRTTSLSIRRLPTQLRNTRTRPEPLLRRRRTPITRPAAIPTSIITSCWRSSIPTRRLKPSLLYGSARRTAPATNTSTAGRPLECLQRPFAQPRTSWSTAELRTAGVVDGPLRLTHRQPGILPWRASGCASSGLRVFLPTTTTAATVSAFWPARLPSPI